MFQPFDTAPRPTQGERIFVGSTAAGIAPSFFTRVLELLMIFRKLQLVLKANQTYLKFVFQLLNRPKIISRKGRKGRQVET
jgi:hypothetical protein